MYALTQHDRLHLPILVIQRFETMSQNFIHVFELCNRQNNIFVYSQSILAKPAMKSRSPFRCIKFSLTSCQRIAASPLARLAYPQWVLVSDRVHKHRNTRLLSINGCDTHIEQVRARAAARCPRCPRCAFHSRRSTPHGQDKRR